MTITADTVRALAAQREGTRLDFKERQYDWKNEGNLELAKDLMAMANALSPNGGDAHILIGVKELPDQSGQIIGVPPDAHLDDASMHQKVQGILNRTPDFSYAQVTVDGVSVGVFEVRPGGRPIFPNHTKGGRLARGVARYRDGSSTAEAWPDRIVTWFQEDHGDRLREAELEALRVQTAVRAVVVRGSASGTAREFSVANGGAVPFTVRSVRAHATPTATVWRENGAEPPDTFPRFELKVQLPHNLPVRPESPPMRLQAALGDTGAYTRQLLGERGQRSIPQWYAVEVEVEVEGPTGRLQRVSELMPYPD